MFSVRSSNLLPSSVLRHAGSASSMAAGVGGSVQKQVVVGGLAVGASKLLDSCCDLGGEERQQQGYQHQQKRGLVVIPYGRRRSSRSPRSSALKRKAFGGRKPTAEIASTMPLSLQEMDNSTLVTLGMLDNHDAHVEMLKRHIMSVDNVDYDTAAKTFKLIEEKNLEGAYLLNLPYNLGIFTAVTAGVASFPLCFHLATAKWFNEAFVTTDVPEPEDLETWLEVGSWTWNWMEPPLGQISFFLLCLQFSRAQMDNLGIKPYTQRVKKMRAEHLAGLFPQYDAEIIMAFSKSSKMVLDRD